VAGIVRVIVAVVAVVAPTVFKSVALDHGQCPYCYDRHVHRHHLALGIMALAIPSIHMLKSEAS